MKKLSIEQHFRATRSPYYIVAPDYTYMSSGVRVLHRLCHVLNSYGLEAYIVTGRTGEELNSPLLTKTVVDRHSQNRQMPIVIYPETYTGRGLGLGVKVRYLLNKPGFIGGPKYFDSNEILIAYQKMFEGEQHVHGLLHLPTCDVTKFNPVNASTEARTGRYVYHNRLLPRGGGLLSWTDGALEISPRSPRPLDELPELFRKAELLYSYEYGSIVVEAMLCGCPVVYVPNSTLLPVFPDGITGRLGAAWGESEEEVAHAKRTVSEVYPLYMSLFDDFHNQLEKFVELTQSAASRVDFQKFFPDPRVIGQFLDRNNSLLPADVSVRGFGYRGVFQSGENLDVLFSNDKLNLRVAIFDCGAVLSLEKTLSSLAEQSRKANRVAILSDIKSFAHERCIGVLGDWTLLLWSGDCLDADALFVFGRYLAASANQNAYFAYFDHDEVFDSGVSQNPQFKPEFNHDLLLSIPYFGRSVAVRTDWLVANLRNDVSSCFDVAFAYDLALKTLSIYGGDSFVRVPSVLVHLRRDVPGIFPNTTDDWIRLAGILENHCSKMSPGFKVVEEPAPGTFHGLFPLSHVPLVSIIVEIAGDVSSLLNCLESLISATNYINFEILVLVDDGVNQNIKENLSILSELDPSKLRIIFGNDLSNFSRRGNSVAKVARGEYLLFLSSKVIAVQPDWLTHMVRHVLRPGVGVVGARLLSSDGSVQHAGIIIGLRGPSEYPCQGLKADEPGYMFRAQLTQNFSAVTAACMLVSKAVYEEVGGLDEDVFAVSYNDVDFCLRVGKTGRRIVWTPLATLLHEGSASQKADIENIAKDKKAKRFTREQAAMYERWPEVIANDPAYNPNLSLVERGYEVETNPLLCYDPLKGLVDHRVVAFAADAFGCGNYRILQPMQAMADAGLCSGGASPELFGPNLALRSGADTLVFQRPSSDSDLALLESLLPLKNIKKIYEVDDDLSRVPMKSAHREHMPKDIRARMIRNIGLCDRLVVSTEMLAHQLRGSNDDIRVVLNRLPPAMWGDAPPTKQASERVANKPRVGWAGGISHQGDLELIAQVVRDTADQVDWVFFGMCPEVIRPYVKEFYAGVPTLEYPKRLMELAQSWDLAVAPLEINPFNDSKSNLRLLEYGWCGLPVVCSDITPYQGDLPVRRVKNRYKDWRAAILEAVSEREASRQMGQALQQRVHSDWMLKGDNLTAWYEAWTGN